MIPLPVREATVLIPATPQHLWGAPAVANFVLGGLGAGFYVAATLAARFGGSAVVTLAAWLGPALVAAGFLAVAAEAERPRRGMRVLARVRTSWMSRELLLGAVFAALAAAEFVAPAPGLRVAAALAAVGLALAQGFIVRRARGVAAWDVGIMPLAFLSSALMAGAGLLLVVEVGRGQFPAGDVLAATLVVLAAATVVWVTYVDWSRDACFLQSTQCLREASTVAGLVGLGHMASFVLVGVALALGEALAPLALVAGALMIAVHVHTRVLLILRAAALRPITLAGLTRRGASS